MKGSLKIDRTVIRPGEKIYTWMEIAEDYAGPVKVPLLAINGNTPGKCLYIESGLYGDEYTGMEAMYRLFRELTPEVIHGKLLAIPMVNTPAFNLISRVGSDGINMNRTSGGKKDGFLTEKIAHFLLEKVISQADHAVEIIDIGMYYAITSFVAVVKKGKDLNLDYAKAYGCDLLWTGAASPTVFRNAIAEKGVEIIMTELGGEGRVHPENVDYEVRCLKNVLKFLRIIDGKPVGLPSRYLLCEGFWMHSQTGGIFRTKVHLRQKVKRGEVLAVIYDLLDKELETILAPYDGIIFGYRTVPRIYPGDWTIWVGKIIKEV